MRYSDATSGVTLLSHSRLSESSPTLGLLTCCSPVSVLRVKPRSVWLCASAVTHTASPPVLGLTSTSSHLSAASVAYAAVLSMLGETTTCVWLFAPSGASAPAVDSMFSLQSLSSKAKDAGDSTSTADGCSELPSELEVLVTPGLTTTLLCFCVPAVAHVVVLKCTPTLELFSSRGNNPGDLKLATTACPELSLVLGVACALMLN